MGYVNKINTNGTKGTLNYGELGFDRYNDENRLYIGSKDANDDPINVNVVASKADALVTTRTISVSGDANGSISFDGTSDEDIDLEVISTKGHILTINKSETGSGVQGDGIAGLEVERGTASNAKIVYNDTIDKWTLDTGNGQIREIKGYHFVGVSSDSTSIDGDYLIVDTSNGAVTITLPNSSDVTDGTVIMILDAKGTFDENNVIVDGNGHNVMGYSSINLDEQSKEYKVIYNGTEWRIA